METVDLLGWIATFSSIAVQFVGIEICVRIWKKGSTGDISPAPFVANFVAACLWLRYGFIKLIQTIIIVNLLGAILSLLYIIFFFFYSLRKNLILKFMFVGCITLFSPLLYIKYYQDDIKIAVENLGRICVVMTVVSYAAPLASLLDVFKSRSTECMSFPLVLAYFVLSVEWFIYGSLLGDQYVQMPNFMGIVLGVLQLGLFVIYPRSSHTLPQTA